MRHTVRILGLLLGLVAAGELSAGEGALPVPARKVCTNVSCAAAACPAGTASQHGACRCNNSCNCTGSVKCYDGAGVLIATQTCSGVCDWLSPSPADPSVPPSTRTCEPAGEPAEERTRPAPTVTPQE